ncbi:unnamed protein product [Prunus armeniaca]|uniref:Uncharacterized protein n=1 Tax=Prunus armeniaca TaxID=36596 RepID=A0A6J5Y3A0_PRUAR|nr:unnamed protein product [Prunus armeniaca]CAB4317944.1 unnamed protein product [Prunus armeniaca]
MGELKEENMEVAAARMSFKKSFSRSKSTRCIDAAQINPTNISFGKIYPCPEADKALFRSLSVVDINRERKIAHSASLPSHLSTPRHDFDYRSSRRIFIGSYPFNKKIEKTSSFSKIKEWLPLLFSREKRKKRVV